MKKNRICSRLIDVLLVIGFVLTAPAVMAQSRDFEIKDGVLVKYRGNAANVVVPEGVTAIGFGAFFSCTSMTSITLPEGLTSIGSGAFTTCVNLVSIALPASLTSIGTRAFSYCGNLASITLSASLTSIGEGAFQYCYELASIQADKENSVYTDRDGVLFNKAGTELIQYPAGKPESRYTVPEGVTVIDDNAFSWCRRLASVTLPASLTAIEKSAFLHCDGLRSIRLPASLTRIGNFAFDECRNLTSIVDPASKPPVLDNVLWGSEPYPPAVIYVPAASVDAYKNAEGWKQYADRIQAIKE